MKLQEKTVVDVENMLDYLMGACGLASTGDKEALEEGAFDYAYMVLEAAEKALQKIEMYEITKSALEESKRLTSIEDFEAADKLILEIAREMREKSGTNTKLRQLYGKASND